MFSNDSIKSSPIVMIFDEENCQVFETQCMNLFSVFLTFTINRHPSVCIANIAIFLTKFSHSILKF